MLGNCIDRMDLRYSLASSRTWPGMLLPVAREKDAWGGGVGIAGKGIILKKHNGECGQQRTVECRSARCE